MFFSNALRSKLASLLRPWLENEPELEVKLGLLTSTGCATNLSLDPSRVNPSIKESTQLEFKRVTIGELRVQISPWSRPSLILDVRGLHVTLAPREHTDVRRVNARDLGARERKETIASVDPEGSSLHEIIENVLIGASSDSRTMKFLVNAMIRCCQVRLHDIHLQLQLTEHHACLLKMSDFSLQPQLPYSINLFRGLIGSFLVSQTQTILEINCPCTEFELRENDQMNRITSFTGLSSCIRLTNFQPLQYGIKVSHLDFKISPTFVPIFMLLLDVLSSKGFEGVRNGRELWKVVTKKLVYSTATPRLVKLGILVVLWSRYIHAYESLLRVVGYSTDSAIQEKISRLSNDRKHLIHVKHQWRIVHELEEKLPAEAVGRARRIARYRVLLHLGPFDLKSPTGLFVTLMLKILSPVLLIWKVICFMFQSLVHVCFMRHYLDKGISSSSMLLLPSFSNNCGSQHFSFILEELSITLCHAICDDTSGSGILRSGSTLAPLKMSSFCLSAMSSCLIYATDGNSKAFFVSSGELKLLFSHSTMETESITQRKSSSRGLKHGPAAEAKVILWTDPALMYQPSETEVTSSSNSIKNAPFVVLKNSIEDLWSTWKMISGQSKDTNVQFKEYPFLLFEIRSFLVNPYFSREGSGFSKCSFSLGKLNLDFDYSAIVSAMLLFRQVQDYHQAINTIGRTQKLTPSSGVLEQTSQEQIKLCITRMKAAMLNMIPAKNTQVGVLIGGPNIRFSMHSEQWSTAAEHFDFSSIASRGNKNLCFALELEDIQFIIWPTAKAILTAMTGEESFREATTEYICLEEPRPVDSAQANGSFVSQGRVAVDALLKFKGLVAFFDDSDANQQYHVIQLMPVIIQASTCRDFIHSLSPTVNVFSVCLKVLVTGAAVSLHIDDLCTFLQVFKGILLEAPSSYVIFDSAVHGLSEDLITKLISSTETSMRTSRKEPAIDGTSIATSTQVLLDASLQIESVDVVVNNSQNYQGMGSSMRNYGTFIHPTRSRSMSSIETMIPDLIDMQHFGIGVFIQKSFFQISCEEHHTVIEFDTSGIKSVISDCLSWVGVCTDLFQIKSLISQNFNHFYQISLSKCNFILHDSGASTSASSSDVIDSSTGDSRISYNAVEFPLNIEGSKLHGPVCNLRKVQLRTASAPGSTCGWWIVAEAKVSEICIAEYHMRNLVIGAHQPNNIKLSVLVSRELDTISFNIQGGYIFLETAALAMFIHCFQVYALIITSHTALTLKASGESSRGTRKFPSLAEIAPQQRNESNDKCVMNAESPASYLKVHKAFRWNFLKALTAELSQFSLILAVTDGSGGAQELILEADMRLEIITFGKNLSFDLNRLTVLTKHLHRILSCQPSGSLIQPIHSNTLDALSMHNNHGNNAPEIIDAQPASHQASREKLAENCPSDCSSCPDSYILKHVTGSIMIEKTVLGSEVNWMQLKSNWFGNGSISGFDLTIRLLEIEEYLKSEKEYLKSERSGEIRLQNCLMLLNLSAPLSEIYGAQTRVNSKQSIIPRNHGWANNSDHIIPDGAIVAIEDLHQHMYFAAEVVDGKFHAVGTLHYSLVGERSLFRVNYHRRWGSRLSWISFISLYAKNEEGTPLRLNCSPGSGFVEISSSKDNSWSLWQSLPYVHDAYEDDDDVRSCDMNVRKAFHLINKKNDCGIAFIDGLPEIVKKPGNPLKVKVFDETSLMHDMGRLAVSNKTFDGSHDTNVPESSCIEGVILESDSNFSRVNITIEKICLTILHEVSDTSDEFPLIQGCVNDLNVIAQMLPSKFRIISSFNIAVHYFDAQGQLWKELLSPVNSYLFYRSRIAYPDLINAHVGVPVHFYFRMAQVDLYLTEISLDMLLFLAGKLNISGPYAVRSSSIFPNTCKLENHSGLNLLCHFTNNQDVIVTGKQSASIFLRYVPLVDQDQESRSLASISLMKGHFSTVPINISLAKSHVFAWRTRVASVHDSNSFPGPFVVVEVSKNAEEGLTLVVSPLLRIHNESGLSMELRFRRQQESEKESASVLLRHGDTIDDSIAVFDALDMSGGSKKALISLTLGNFLLSLRPEVSESIKKGTESISTNWSEDVKGGKAVRLTGIFDTLNYKFKKAFGVLSEKCLFSSLYCPLTINGQHASNMYFLIQTISKDVPLMQPPKLGDTLESTISPVAMQLQKELFIYPTVQVYNLLQMDVHCLLTESNPDSCVTQDYNNIGKEATISCGSSAYFYANPTMIFFIITLNKYGSKSKPVNSGDWVKKLKKQKNDVPYLDITLEFGGGKYFASLRLSRADKGILEVFVFTTYSLQNNTDHFLFLSPSNQKHVSGEKSGNYNLNLPPELGCYLPPNSTTTWLLKSNKVQINLMEHKTSKALLDLDTLSGFTELCLEAKDDLGINCVAKLGVSLQPCMHKVSVPSQVVCMVPRYVVSNETKKCIKVRQCYLEDGIGGVISIGAEQKIALQVWNNKRKRMQPGFIDSVLKRHRDANQDSQFFVQFCPEEREYSWSGPICVASLGRFFLKFKGSSDTLANQSHTILQKKNPVEFASVHIVEESSSLLLHFYMPPNIALPYRIENSLRGLSILYHQKESMASDILDSGDSVGYAWDDLNLPHKLIVEIVDIHLLREINIDKISTWKPLFKMRQTKQMVLHLPFNKSFGMENESDMARGSEAFKVGYEVHADGLTRVLRICESGDSYKEEKMLQPCANIQLRVSFFGLHFVGNNNQDINENEVPVYSTIIFANLANFTLDSLIMEQYNYNRIRVQSLSVDEKWPGAPFASMLRRSELYDSRLNENVLNIIFILHLGNSSVKQVKYASIILQPIDLKVDEETLMRLVPFWRTSLSVSKSESRQFYFKHFEVHPIKIIASFLPGNPYSRYSSAQETLRSLLHSIIKVPAVHNTVVELNGVLLTHALLTFRELLIKCAQHYSWYVVRAIYKTKGSALLPPGFASIFDDTASSSLDVFFDPSDGSVNLPGLTLGMFKFISKCIDSKGFSGTKRYFGDLGKTVKMASSNALFAATTEISDSVLRGAEANGLSGMVNGFHQGILKLAMEPSFLGAAVMEGGPDRKIMLDRSPGIDELYIEGYLQAMLDVMYKQEYLRARVIDNQVLLKNLPPSSSLINEIVENVRSFLVSKALLKGDSSMASRPLRHLRSASEWKIGPTVLTLCEHLFVSFVVRMLHKQVNQFRIGIRWKQKADGGDRDEAFPEGNKKTLNRSWVISKFVFSGMIAYLDGRLCRHIPNPIARRIVSGFLLSFLDKKDGE